MRSTPVVTLVACFGTVIFAVVDRTPVRDVHDLLRQVGGMNAADLQAIDRGEVITRVLDTDRRQIAVVGAVRVRVTREPLVARYADIANLARSPVVLELGGFSSPPRADDLRLLNFEEYDLRSVRECEPGDCPVRLSGEAMILLREGVNWRSPDWQSQAAAAWRRFLAGYAAAYSTSGELAEYHNKEPRLRMQDEFAILFGGSGRVAALAPEFLRYLRDYPRSRPAGVTDTLYWSKEKFGARPVVSISHLTTYTPADSRNAYIATKQVYATHYFDAGLWLTLIVDDAEGGSYIISINRARTRSLTSLLRGFVRSTVQARSREALEKTLRSVRDAVGNR